MKSCESGLEVENKVTVGQQVFIHMQNIPPPLPTHIPPHHHHNYHHTHIYLQCQQRSQGENQISV